MTTILGVDCGMAGALSFYDGDELIIYDMPVLARSKTKRVDCHKLNSILRSGFADHAFIEQVNAFGMGATGAYNFGWSWALHRQTMPPQSLPCLY